MSAQFQIPLQTVIPGQLIASSLWNNEWNNLDTNFIPAGMDSYSDTDAQMQIQTNPFPGSVTSHATSLGGEIERIRYQIAAITGKTYWYNAPDISIANTQNSLVPVGGVIDYPSATAPNANWHLADGTAISRALYPALFTLMGTTFGVGDGSTTFNLPNYTDRMAIAAGNLYALGATGGEAAHTLVTGEIPAHNHAVSITDPGHAHNTVIPFVSGGVNGKLGITSLDSPANQTFGSNSNTTGVTASSSNTGGGAAHNNLPPYLGMYKMVRVI